MKRHYMHFVLLIFLLRALKTSGSNYDDYEDYNYSDYDESEESTEATVGTKPMYTTTVAPTTRSPIKTIKSESKCPADCVCSVTLDHVDCSNKNLKQIPKGIPYNTVQLNLSHNLLKTLDVNDLIECKELQQVYLSDNQIESIANYEGLSRLPSLTHIDLSSNDLNPLQGNEFSRAHGLLTLILKNNTRIVRPNTPIVRPVKLKTLDLSHCNISKLSGNAFANLSSLTTLDLSENPLKLDGNMSAFKYLINLRMLSIPTVAQRVAHNLCKSLEIIDIIHLTLENHDLSCFLLTSGSTYDESTIRNDLYKVPTDPPSFNDSSNTADDDSAENDADDIIVLDSKQTNDAALKQTSYEKMCIVYMLLAGLVVVSLIGLLVSFCMLGTHRFGRELWYRKQNYQKYYSENIANENGNFENILIENVEKQ